MKSFITCFILCGLVVLVGCGGDSAKQPVVPPSGGDDVWQITALEVNPTSSPLVGTSVTLVATVALNGSAAPDGTKVEFLSNAGEFNGVAQQEVDVLTSGGNAGVTFGATEAGPYRIQARVKTVTSSVTVTYEESSSSDSLQIYNVNPTAGSYLGGEVVILTGKGIRAPAEVFFSIQGIEYQAIVVAVVPSNPAADPGSITIRTPEPTAADNTITFAADLRTVVGVGTDTEEQQSLPSAFTFIGNTDPPPGVPPTPVIFGVDPYYGRSAGGDIVTVIGMDFQWEDDGAEIEDTFDEVYFTFQGEDLLAQVERSSATQIELITPRFSISPLQDDTNAGIKLTRVGEAPVEKNDVFIVMSDVAIPEVTGLSPMAGPMDGGTVVTINGHGFELPLTVHFGNLEATNVQLFDDQGLSDNDIITCTTPDYSQQGQTPPLFVEVAVTNLQSGLTSTAPFNFRYGDSLYITQANPTEGQIGDQFALYGAGFEDPLTVWFRSGGEVEFDVISVTGTELALRSPPDMAPTCVDRSGDFMVVLNESGQFAEGGMYTLLGDDPTITSVDPIFVQEADNGDAVLPSAIDIYGVRFQDDLLVLVDTYTIDPTFVQVESEEHIHVFQIPAPNDFGLVFATTSCTTDTGLQGVKEVATPVDVTVRNLPLGCQDTLRQTLVYVPEDETCVVAPAMQVAVPFFPDTEAGLCSPLQQLIISNNGAGTLEIQNLFLQGRFFFDAGGVSQNAGPLSIPPFSFDDSLSLSFCPDEPTGGQYLGQLVISSNNPGSPNASPLTGTESTPPEIEAAPLGDGDSFALPNTTVGDCSADEYLTTITNIGVAPLMLNSITVVAPFEIASAPSGQLDPAMSGDIYVRFCPTAAGAASATLEINHNAVNEPNPISITLDGTGN